MPDAAKYGDVGSDTLGNIARARQLHCPNFCALGLANIKPLTGLAPVADRQGLTENARSPRLARTQATGHWEMVSVYLEKPFPLFPHGFPSQVMGEFAEAHQAPRNQQQGRIRHTEI